MGRPLRLQSPLLQYHIMLKCNAPQFRFETTEDFAYYLETLRFVQRKHRFQLFNFELLPERVHLFLQPSSQIPLARTMQLLNWKFSRDFNRAKGRRGCFWKNRYRSTPVEPGRHALVLMRAMNRSPVKEGLVNAPGEWNWSAYSALALGAAQDLITLHPSYLAMGEEPETRRKKYERIVRFTPRHGKARPDIFHSRPYLGSKAFGEKCVLPKISRKAEGSDSSFGD